MTTKTVTTCDRCGRDLDGRGSYLVFIYGERRGPDVSPMYQFDLCVSCQVDLRSVFLHPEQPA